MSQQLAAIEAIIEGSWPWALTARMERILMIIEKKDYKKIVIYHMISVHVRLFIFRFSSIFSL